MYSKQDPDRARPARPDLAIMIGPPAAGKSTLCCTALADSHVRLNLDMLRDRSRERILFYACLAAQQSCCLDNTSPTRQVRQPFIAAAHAAGFTCSAYWFHVADLDLCHKRNRSRAGAVPDVAVTSIFAKMQEPTFTEGFDHIYAVDSHDLSTVEIDRRDLHAAVQE